MAMNKHFFYVLRCRDGSLYAGYTNDLSKRISLHNAGKAAKYTRGRGPVELVFSKEFPSKTEAMKAEYRFKQLRRPIKLEFIEKESDFFNVAAEEL
ncbi:endonuclease [Bacillus sp. M6-12]|uniref:GIY-YIG nuclease family protein n=1 Tax=Bacillus sp. M6-12 TaxID=2054166 RepID=UPI000C78D545|nr:GIY-YIG nuclease family protein [Bacillus sp. M6-12]PLS15104.1 endonuclease [Bacillus sp. M6-12]